VAEINFRCLTRQCVSITNDRHCNDATLAMQSTAHGSVRNNMNPHEQNQTIDGFN